MLISFTTRINGPIFPFTSFFCRLQRLFSLFSLHSFQVHYSSFGSLSLWVERAASKWCAFFSVVLTNFGSIICCNTLSFQCVINVGRLILGKLDGSKRENKNRRKNTHLTNRMICWSRCSWKWNGKTIELITKVNNFIIRCGEPSNMEKKRKRKKKERECKVPSSSRRIQLDVRWVWLDCVNIQYFSCIRHFPVFSFSFIS